MKTCLKDLDVEGETDASKEEIKKVLRTLYIKSRDDRMDSDIGDFTIFVPSSKDLPMHDLKQSIEEAGYGLISRYPMMKDSTFVINIKEEVVRDGIIVSPEEIRLLMIEKFEVNIITPIDTVRVNVDDTTTVGQLRRKMKKKLKAHGKKMEDIFGLAFKLELDGEKLKNETMMYDLGVRACLDKCNILWDNREKDNVFIDKV